MYKQVEINVIYIYIYIYIYASLYILLLFYLILISVIGKHAEFIISIIQLFMPTNIQYFLFNMSVFINFFTSNPILC